MQRSRAYEQRESKRKLHTLLIQPILIDDNYKTMIIKPVVYDLQYDFTNISRHIVLYLYIYSIYHINRVYNNSFGKKYQKIYIFFLQAKKALQLINKLRFIINEKIYILFFYIIITIFS